MRTFIRLTNLLTLFIAASFLFSSCDKEEEHYSIGDFMVSFGVVETSDTVTHSLSVRMDSGDQMVSIVPLPNHVEFSAGQRVLVNFAPYGDKINADSSVTYLGKYNKIQNILFKEILPKSQLTNDSIGKDPVMIRESWLTGDSILNIRFSYYSRGTRHTVNLVDTGEGDGILKPYVFEFRHNNGGDISGYPASGYVSFKLDPVKVPGENSVDFYIRYSDFTGKIIAIPHTITY
jgi:hypothetical protein